MYTKHALLSILYLLVIPFCFAAPIASIRPKPDWVIPHTPVKNNKVNEREVSYGYYKILHDDQVNIGEQTYYRHSIKEIINGSGIQESSEITVSFSSSYQSLFFHTVNIIRDGKIINKLSQSAIKVVNEEPELAEFKIYDYSKAIIILDDVRKGDKIELAYSLKGFNPIYKQKYDDVYTFANNTLVSNYYMTAIIPQGRALKFKYHNDAPQPVVTNNKNQTIYNWPVQHIKPYKDEGNTPAWYYDVPFIEVSEYTDWKDVANWAGSIMTLTTDPLPSALTTLINTWDKEANGNEVKFATHALRFVQNDIRYLGIEIGNYTYQPHSPAFTFNNRYGDCKDKSQLLVAILRSKNIPANITLVNSVLGSETKKRLPGAGKFNHAIVQLKLNGQTLYVDPTFNAQEGSIMRNYLPDYGSGLVITPNTTTLTSIPFNNTGSTVIHEKFDISSKGSSTLTVSTTLTGCDADYMRSSITYNGLYELEQQYEQYYSKSYNLAVTKDEIVYKDDKESNTITLLESYTLDSLWQNTDDKETIYIYGRAIYDRLVTPEKQNITKPLALSYPVNLSQTIEINMPEEWTFNEKPLHISNALYEFHFTSENTGKQIILDYTLKTFQDYIPTDKLTLYREDYNTISKYLTYEFSNNTRLAKTLSSIEGKGTAANTNWIMIFLAILSAGLALYFCLKFNKYTVESARPYTGEGINGWLIILAIVITLKPFLYFYNLFSTGYFLKKRLI